MSYLDDLQVKQMENTHATRAILDKMEAEGRTAPTVEERTALDALDAEFVERGDNIARRLEQEKRERELDEARGKAPETREQRDGAPVEKVADIIRALGRGELREGSGGEWRDGGYVLETRTNTKGTTTDGGFTVPQGFGGRIIEKLKTIGPLLNPDVVDLTTTDHMRDIPYPIENAAVGGTATAEAAAYGVQTPTFTQKTHRAWKQTAYIAASDELLRSDDVAIENYFERKLVMGLGTAVNNALTLGTGTVQPEGLIAGGSGVTGGTGVSGKPTYEDLVDLETSVDSQYASSPKAAYQMRRTATGVVRKIKDSAGSYIFVQNPRVGEASTINGYPVYENPDVAAVATNAKSIWFGDWSYFLVRQVNGIALDRNDSLGWGSDLVYFKARIWVDSFVGQTEAIKYFAGGTA